MINRSVCACFFALLCPNYRSVSRWHGNSAAMRRPRGFGHVSECALLGVSVGVLVLDPELRYYKIVVFLLKHR